MNLFKKILTNLVTTLFFKISQKRSIVKFLIKKITRNDFHFLKVSFRGSFANCEKVDEYEIFSKKSGTKNVNYLQTFLKFHWTFCQIRAFLLFFNFSSFFALQKKNGWKNNKNEQSSNFGSILSKFLIRSAKL